MNNEHANFSVAASWQVPAYQTTFWLDRCDDWCVVIPVINEGERISNLLRRMATLRIADCADIVIVDGGSTDDSLDPTRLQMLAVRGLLVKTGPGQAERAVTLRLCLRLV